MAELFNSFIDLTRGLTEKIKNSEIYKNSKESLTTNKDINEAIQEIEKNTSIKPYVALVRNASNYTAVKFDFRGDVYSLDFDKRRKIVYFLIGGLLFRHLLKTNYFRRFLFHYILLSSLFCRENFDLRNYEIKPWQKEKLK
jgi:hypothetical protein